MKIAFFTDTYKPQINGVVESIDFFKEGLKKLGHEVFVFCPGGPAEKNVYNINSIVFQRYPEYSVGFPGFDLLQKVTEIKPDIIHVQTPGSVGAGGMIIAKFLGIPLLMTYHTMIPHYLKFFYPDLSDKENERLSSGFTKWFFRKASNLIVPSISIKSYVKNNGINRPIEVLPTGIKTKCERGIRGNKVKRILHVGRLCEQKRIDMVLEAFDEIRKKVNAVLILTSEGPYRSELKKLSKRLGIDKKVIFTGYVSEKELSKLYSSSDLLVSASDTETQGIVVLEAMSCGCPVLARNAPGFRDFVVDGKNGLLFNDKEEMVEKMSILLGNEKIREKIIRNGYRTADDNSIDNCSKRLEALYLKALRKVDKTRTYERVAYGSLLLLLKLNDVENLRVPINSRSLNIFKLLVDLIVRFKI